MQLPATWLFVTIPEEFLLLISGLQTRGDVICKLAGRWDRLVKFADMLTADFLGHCYLADVSGLASSTNVLKLVQSNHQTVADRALRLVPAMGSRPPGPCHAMIFETFQANIHETLSHG